LCVFLNSIFFLEGVGSTLDVSITKKKTKPWAAIFG